VYVCAATHVHAVRETDFETDDYSDSIESKQRYKRVHRSIHQAVRMMTSIAFSCEDLPRQPASVAAGQGEGAAAAAGGTAAATSAGAAHGDAGTSVFTPMSMYSPTAISASVAGGDEHVSSSFLVGSAISSSMRAHGSDAAHVVAVASRSGSPDHFGSTDGDADGVGQPMAPRHVSSLSESLPASGAVLVSRSPMHVASASLMSLPTPSLLALPSAAVTVAHVEHDGGPSPPPRLVVKDRRATGTLFTSRVLRSKSTAVPPLLGAPRSAFLRGSSGSPHSPASSATSASGPVVDWSLHEAVDRCMQSVTVVDVRVAPAVFDLLPEEFTKNTIPVIPVLFSQVQRPQW
jgi:hypothetical protein